MPENRNFIFSIIAIILAISGIGVGAYSVINFQLIEGPPGQDAPGGLMIGVLDPDDGEIVSGDVSIRIIVYGSEDYTLSILRNGTEIGASENLVWDSTSVNDGWWNLTFILTDLESSNSSREEIHIFVDNSPNYWYVPTVVYSNVITGDSWTNTHYNITFTSCREANYFMLFEAHVKVNPGARFESRFSLNGSYFTVLCASYSTEWESFSDSYVWENVSPGTYSIMVQVKSSVSNSAEYHAPSLFVQRI